ncbi:hypothetical protein [Paenibacillus lactis]|uniref:hypothetical protein n=1 Tax=Paenibacillus lactis TaxID=228574 RepID=UPI0036A7C48A
MNINWGTILTSSVVSTLITVILGGIIKYSSDKSLETHKQKINELNDSLRFNLQRQIHDFNQYSVKRHSLYPEVYKLLLIAHGNISSLYGLKRSLSFEEFNDQDFEMFMEKENIPLGKQTSISSMLSAGNKKDAIENLRLYLRNLEFQEARKSLQEAINLILFSELFMSDQVSKGSKKTTNLLNEMLLYTEYPEPGSHKERDRINDQVGEELSELKKTMKEELSSSYYDNYK